LRALLLQVLYSVRSERLLMEQLGYNLLFTADGTLIQAWAGQKSFRAKKKGSQRDIPPEDLGNATVDFHGEKRSNDTHQSTTDRRARLYKKSKGTEAKLSYLGHVLAENRNRLVVQARVTMATGTAEREAELESSKREPAGDGGRWEATKDTTCTSLWPMCAIWA
jgi:hypothetical protein